MLAERWLWLDRRRIAGIRRKIQQRPGVANVAGNNLTDVSSQDLWN